jgi:hypothetical protein
MAFEDLPLDRPETAQPPGGPVSAPPQSSPTRWVIVGACMVIAIALLALWWISRAQPRAAIPAPTNATDVAVGSNRPKRQPIALPLRSMDPMRCSASWVAQLSRHPLIARAAGHRRPRPRRRAGR